MPLLWSLTSVFGCEDSGVLFGGVLRRVLGRVLPELAGLGRMKVNSKVPPIARVCGKNDGRLCRAGCFRWSFAAQLA